MVHHRDITWVGRAWAIAALERGDKVAATARDTKTLADMSRKTWEEWQPVSVLAQG